ncbi:DEAD/DEAH box helicase [Rahnella sp. L72c]|uniref:DNA 3'-5' helicase n=1 Tax=Rahnella perminowiae TaxID=2816244 RepID=A0ABS6KVK5_9GAMM|nr:UvrD-helicase domain-containing protein [Rahnella perminowiae]MBU9833646.1 DEAD/DEAH box helicase [Rahnella perminowiae]
MKALIDVRPTAEQLALFSRIQPGVEIIRGAAGSGKTTTALLKLRSAIGFYLNRRRRQSEPKAVNVLVLTFNKTLRGYIKELASKQVSQDDAIKLEITTFNAWSRRHVDCSAILTIDQTQTLLESYSRNISADVKFFADEAAYVLGRFPFGQLDEYLSSRRDGRGISPRMERPSRVLLLENVIKPYLNYKKKNNYMDWNDLAIEMYSTLYESYDVIVVDETQDFSANEIRAIMKQSARESTITFVLDSVQKIYSRSFSWAEVGISIRPENSHKLSINYRNTKEIALLAAALLQGVRTDDDGSLPDFSNVERRGSLPLVICGDYISQASYCVEYIKENINLETDSVAFLHPKGWFRDLVPILGQSRLPYKVIQSQSEWPSGEENIALTTFHSAKGLEFDHVFMIGLDGSILNSAKSEDLDYEDTARLRRLVAMGVGRARESVIIGFSKHDMPSISSCLQNVTVRLEL